MTGVRTNRLRREELNQIFLNALGDACSKHNALDSKPLDADLSGLIKLSIRAYIYHATYPPGGRTLGERKIQLIVPGQKRGQRGNFDLSEGRFVLLVGYEVDADVFILWDSGMYRDFTYSMNVQVNPKTIMKAVAGDISLQVRHRRTPVIGTETVVCSHSSKLVGAIHKRWNLSLERIIGASGE